MEGIEIRKGEHHTISTWFPKQGTTMNCYSCCCCCSSSSSFTSPSSSSSSSSSTTSFLLLRPPHHRKSSSLTTHPALVQFQFQNVEFPTKITSKPSLIITTQNKNYTKNLIKVRARRRGGRDVEEEEDDSGGGGGSSGDDDVLASASTITVVPKGSGTTARGRRLLKVREEKRKREFDRLHNYPSWAKVLEDACKEDTELRAVLGDSIGNPDLMRERVEQRVRQKGREFRKSKTGSVLAFKVSFRDFNPVDSYIWFELYGSPSDRDVDLIGSVIQSWYVMGRLGAFNSSNLQLANSSMNYDPLYDADKGFNVMPSSFHDIGDVEFQDNWGRVWVDIGTCDLFAIDVLLNCLTVLSSEYIGIQQVVFGGRRMGDWEEGMTSPEYGYKYFKI